MAGAFDRVTWMLLLCSAAILPGSVTWTASVAHAADAGAAGAGGGTAGEQAPAEEGPQEEAEESTDSEEAEAEPVEEAQPEESAEAELARQAAELERQAAERAALQPPLVAEADENSGNAPTEMGKRDFLRRLRTTAESIERGRTSERTEAHTDGDVTVLSNVGGPGQDAPEKVDVNRQEQESANEAPALPNAESETQDRETSAYANSVTARDRPLDEPEGQWHWLWWLGGLATALLLPIGILLTRATRSS